MRDFAQIYEAGLYEGDCPLAPGEVVERSGIYAICHADGARHTIVLVRGNSFPDCECCGREVRFRLVRSAPYIFEDPDFKPGG